WRIILTECNDVIAGHRTVVRFGGGKSEVSGGIGHPTGHPASLGVKEHLCIFGRLAIERQCACDGDGFRLRAPSSYKNCEHQNKITSKHVCSIPVVASQKYREKPAGARAHLRWNRRLRPSPRPDSWPYRCCPEQNGHCHRTSQSLHRLDAGYRSC